MEPSARIAEARWWAAYYAALGWRVTPSCPGTNLCTQPELHPATPTWRAEATTDPIALDALWAPRAASGVIAVAGEGMTALHIDASAALCLAAFAEGRITVPLARRGRDDVYAIVRPEATVELHERLRPHDPFRPLPLPASDAEGPLRWVTPPERLVPLLPLGAVAQALTTAIELPC